VVALSALAGAEERERALAAGFEEHIAKPVGMRELARTLGELVAPARSSSVST
jgi:CheY-like chemotaxis protein